MFCARIGAVALSLFTVAQAAIVINSVNVIGNGTSTILFSSTDPGNDPNTISIVLTNPLFHTQFAVGNNIPSDSGNFTFETPQLTPGPDYGIQFISIFNNSDILAMSPTFSIAENDVKSSTKTGSPSTATSGTSSGPSSSNPTFTNVPSQTGATPSATQPGSASNTGSSSAPPASTSNTVFGGNTGGATGLQASFALGVVGVAFAFL